MRSPRRSHSRRLPALWPTLTVVGLLLLLARPASAQPDGTGPWPTSPPAAQGVDPATWNAMVALVEQDPRFARAHALLLVRHGTLIGEAYFRGASSEDLRDLRSVTKSVTSMATGIAIRRGEIAGTEARIVDLLPAYASHLLGRPQENLTLEHVLTMQAGLEWNDSRQPWLDQIFVAPDLVDYALSRPTVAPPGAEFVYSTALTQVLAKILIEWSGGTLPDYVQRHLFDPVGIRRSAWRLRPSGDHHGGLGLQIRARDAARLGQLALQRGFWTDRQVVPESWMNRSIRDARRTGVYGYGYQWWRLDALQPPATERFAALGYGGQVVDVDRTLDTVLCLIVEWNVAADQQIPLAAFDELRALLRAGLQPLGESEIFIQQSPDPEIPTEETIVTDEPSSGRAFFPLWLHRTGSADGALTVRVRTRSGTAQSGDDFVPWRGQVRWPAGDSTPRLLEIAISADGAAEPDELFHLDVDRLTGNGSVRTPRVDVVVRDAGAASTRLSWSRATTVVREGDPVEVDLERDGNDLSALEVVVDVQHVTTDSDDFSATASAGTPSAVRVPATFPAGQRTAQVRIDTTHDSEVEAEEIFELAVLPGPGFESPAPLRGALVDPSSGDATTCEGTSCFLGRYRASVTWLDPRTQQTGRGTFTEIPNLSPSATSQSAAVTFFDPDNVEVLFKVLDGTAVNGRIWSFLAKVTDLPLWLVLTDTQTGVGRLWHTPGGSLCGIADVEGLSGSSDLSAPSGPSARPPLATESDATTHAGNDCPDDSLCLQDRFEVRLTVEHGGEQLAGRPAPGSSTAGAFWVFDPANAEVAVKILDGRDINGHHWIYAGALTDLPYRVLVHDRVTDAEHVFTPEGTLCGLADTATL